MRAIHIGLDEGIGGEQGSIDMGFSRKVDDRIDVMFAQRGIDHFGITDIAFNKFVTRLEFFCQIAQVIKVSCIGELIKDNDIEIGMVLQNVPDVIRTDEPRSTGD